MPITVGIFVFDEVEVLDFAGPYEVFATAARLSVPPAFEVGLIGAEQITARGGLRVQPEYSLQAHPELDVLLVPGGVVSQPQNDAHMLAWLQRQAELVSTVASVCTGALLLGQLGLLDGLRVTTHWEDLAELQRCAPNTEVVEGVRWVRAGQVYTSAGISAGIDMSLALVEDLAGAELAQQTARQMDYRWLRD